MNPDDIFKSLEHPPVFFHTNPENLFSASSFVIRYVMNPGLLLSLKDTFKNLHRMQYSPLRLIEVNL